MDHDPYSAGGGGGFMAQGGASSPGGGSQKKFTDRGKQSLRPVTIKQFLNATQNGADGDFAIDDTDVHQLTIVAVVRNLVTQATNVSLSLEDGTGSCEARLWLANTDGDDGRLNGIDHDVYVRVIGSMKSFGGKNHFAATQVRAIEDMNEIAYHLLEAQYVSLLLRNGPLDEAAQNGTGAGTGGPTSNANDYSAGGGGGGNSAIDDAFSHLQPVHRKIMQFVSGESDPVGFHVRHITQKLGPYFTDDAIAEAIEFLLSDGHLFTTDDDEHVLPT